MGFLLFTLGSPDFQTQVFILEHFFFHLSLPRSLPPLYLLYSWAHFNPLWCSMRSGQKYPGHCVVVLVLDPSSASNDIWSPFYIHCYVVPRQTWGRGVDWCNGSQSPQPHSDCSLNNISHLISLLIKLEQPRNRETGSLPDTAGWWRKYNKETSILFYFAAGLLSANNPC